MPHTQYTLLLNNKWDISLNEVGLIQTVQNDYAIAQSVANECRCFTDDLVFDTTNGIPWFNAQLGHRIMESLTTTYLRRAAERVEEVERVDRITLDVQEFNPSVRELSGTLEFTVVDGTNVTIEL